MKKKILLIILILFFVIGCNKKEENATSDASTEKEKKIEIVTHTDDEMTDKLKEYGEKLYESKEYLNFTKYGEVYFASLNDLEKLNYDVDYFIDKEKNECEKNRTGIYFDPNYSSVPYDEHTKPIMYVFYGCTNFDFSTEEDTYLNESNTENSN